MFNKDIINGILEQAIRIDSKYEIYTASTHKYKLNPPVSKEFVRKVEEKYHFTLPEDYVQFITEIGDGGAGPGHGMYQFGNILAKGQTLAIEKLYEEYRHGLAEEFIPQSWVLGKDEEENFEEYYDFISKEEYKKNPGIYFVCENNNGFLHLGSYGGLREFGLVTSGKRYGQIFDTDREGFYYSFTAYSFSEFYQSWLDDISDIEKLKKDLKFWRRE